MATVMPGQPLPLPPTDLSQAPRDALPTMYDLPSEDPEDGLPDEFHIYQPRLLQETFQPPTYPPDRVFVATDLYLYYTLRNITWHKRPDWFAALGASRLYRDQELRLNYLIWQENVPPYLVVELLSPSTEQEDLGRTVRHADQPPTKWMVYEQILQVPYYVLFGHQTTQPRYFQLVNGRYQAIQPSGWRLWLPEAGLGLGLWQGGYHGVERRWLRFYDAAGQWISTPLEQEQQRVEQERQRAKQERQRAERASQRAKQERQRAEQAEQLAEQERQRAERLAARLKALGIEPDEAP